MLNFSRAFWPKDKVHIVHILSGSLTLPKQSRVSICLCKVSKWLKVPGRGHYKHVTHFSSAQFMEIWNEAGVSRTGPGQQGQSFLSVCTTESSFLTPHLLEHPAQCWVYFGLIWQIFLSGGVTVQGLVACFHVSLPSWVNLGQECEEIVGDTGARAHVNWGSDREIILCDGCCWRRCRSSVWDRRMFQ